MVPVKELIQSSIGKKYFMAVTGLALVGFIIVHLLGNLTLYAGAEQFNNYAWTLHSLGPTLWVAEIGLIAIFLVHIVVAAGIHTYKYKARGGFSRYGHAQHSKGGGSHYNIFSRGMIVTGGVLLVFLIIHIMHFKFGLFSPAEIADKSTTIDGVEGGDLYARVAHAFTNPLWVIFYVVVMLFLGGHLRHGFWSAFQSLGALNHRLEKPATVIAAVVAVLLALGFLGIPIFLFVTQGA